MTVPPLISVLMPVFNAAGTVEAAIRSILAQSCADLELVVQDDGSTDGSVAVIRRLASEDPRIVLPPPFERNLGLVAARNGLLDRARGDFLAFMDADDVSAPERLARQVRFLLDNPGVAAVGTAIRYADPALRPLQERRFSPDPDRQARDPDICCATVMVRRQAAEAAGRFRPLFRLGGEDGDWLLRLCDHGAVTNLDDVLYVYRQHENTSARNAGAIRRLGVLARHAARLRRQGQGDPLDNVQSPEDLGGLADAYFLDCPGLTAEERLTALSLPLAGQKPLVSVLMVGGGRPPDPNVLAGWAHQSFRNFEILLDEATLGDTAVARALDAIAPALRVRSVVTVPGQSHPRGVAIWQDLTAARFIAWHDGAVPPPSDSIEAHLRALLGAASAQVASVTISVGAENGDPRREMRTLRIVDRQFLSGCSAFLLLRSIAERGLAFIDGHWRWQSGAPDSDGATPSPAGRGPTTEDDAARRASQAFLHLRRSGIDGTALGRAYVVSVLRGVRQRRQSPVILVGLALQYPRSLSSAATDLLRRKAGLGRQPTAVTAVAPATLAVAAPAIVTRRRAEMVVRCLDDWGDLDDALNYLTPGGRGLWGRVAFERQTEFAPDWHVIFNGPGRMAVDIVASPNRVLFAVGEPPTRAHRALHEGQGEGTLVLTSDERLVARLDSPRRYLLAPAMLRTWSVRQTYSALRATSVVDKPCLLSWVTSNLALLVGHRYRLAFLDRLRQAVDFDLYGRGFRPIADKWEALAPYRYSIAFENARSGHYFSEKLMDCFVAETMPLYFGSPAIERFFPPEAMVVIDPEDPDVLRRICDTIASDLWVKNREAVREAKRLALEKYNVFAFLADVMSRQTEPPLPPCPLRLVPVLPDFDAVD